jgi:NAD(P)-dependent dehydrogenase (short-subunit alcohol dehydrogenase family)
LPFFIDSFEQVLQLVVLIISTNLHNSTKMKKKSNELVGFAKSAALSYAKENIMCNVICPALVNTKLANNPYILEKMAPNSPKMETIWDMLKGGNPIPRGFYEPIDIAKVVMIFAGDATAKVTGEVFDVSLGVSARNIA